MSIIPIVHASDLRQDYGFANINNVPDLIAKLLEPAFAIAGVIVVFYFLIAAFKILTSGGDKNAVAQARAMITHAVIGLVLLLMMWIVLRFVPQFFGLQGFNLFGS